jgi:DnaJ-class molecular chaperone
MSKPKIKKIVKRMKINHPPPQSNVCKNCSGLGFVHDSRCKICNGLGIIKTKG